MSRLPSNIDPRQPPTSPSPSPSPPPPPSSYPPPPSDPPPPWLLPKEYGPIGEVGVDVPAAGDILPLCDFTAECAHLTYQLRDRQFHVKYGLSISWNEVVAQVTAASGLRSISAQALAPTVYHAFQAGRVIIIVMDHVEGDTIMDLCEKSDDEEKGLLAIEAGSALVELARVRLEGNLRPAGVDGGRLSHAFFGDQGATRHYRNASELEGHINLMLSKRSSERLTGLSDEPLVLCQGDPHLSNFIKDRSGRIWLIDFAHVDIVPITFVSCILHSHGWGPKLCGPSEAFDGFRFSSNAKAVYAAAKWVIISSGVWSALGRCAPGGRKTDQDDIKRTKTFQVMI